MKGWVIEVEEQLVLINHIVCPKWPVFSIRMWLSYIAPSMFVLSIDAPFITLIRVCSLRLKGTSMNALPIRKFFTSSLTPYRKLSSAKISATQTRKNLGCDRSKSGSFLSITAQFTIIERRIRSTKIKRIVAANRNFLACTFLLNASQLLHLLITSKEYIYLSWHISHFKPSWPITSSRCSGSSYFLVIHRLKHLLWMYFTLPVHPQGEISLLSGYQGLRHILHSLVQEWEERGRMEIFWVFTCRIVLSCTRGIIGFSIIRKRRRGGLLKYGSFVFQELWENFGEGVVEGVMGGIGVGDGMALGRKRILCIYLRTFLYFISKVGCLLFFLAFSKDLSLLCLPFRSTFFL